MRNAEEVALYAILLREAARNHHTGAQSLLDDFECCRDHVTFATMLAHEHFTELDWQMVELLIDHPTEVLEAAHVLYAEHEQPLEAEALLHAVGTRGKKSRAQWFDPFRERWGQVRASMHAYEREGVVLTLADLDAIAKDTFMANTKVPNVTDDEFFEVFVAPQIDAEQGITPVTDGTVGWYRRQKILGTLHKHRMVEVD
jgi:hypothetical protein